MGMMGMIQHIWRLEGLGGFFKGFGSSLACHVTYSFLWWVNIKYLSFFLQYAILFDCIIHLLKTKNSPHVSFSAHIINCLSYLGGLHIPPLDDN